MTNVPPVPLNNLQENGQFHVHTDFAVMRKFKGPVKITGASSGIECLITNTFIHFIWSYRVIQFKTKCESGYSLKTLSNERILTY